MWIKDNKGNLVNLDHCHQVIVDDSPHEPTNDDDTHAVHAKQMIMNAEHTHELFTGTEEKCKSYLEEVVRALETTAEYKPVQRFV